MIRSSPLISGFSIISLISQELVDFLVTYQQRQKEFLKYHDLTNPERLLFLNHENGKMIYIHRPHPRNTLLKYQLKAILERIGDEI